MLQRSSLSGADGQAGRWSILALDAAGFELIGTASAGASPFQSSQFLRAWMEATDAEIVLLVRETDGHRDLLLPLEIVRRGPWRIACIPGGTHANASGLMRLAPGPEARIGRAGPNAAFAAGGRRVDALDLQRLPETDFLSPEFTVRPAAEERFRLSLLDGMDGVLSRGHGARKRKRFRWRQRYFDDKGGYRFLDVPVAARNEAIATFLAQKRERFAAQDMPDPFAAPEIAAFISNLFEDGTGTRLYAIESGGIYKALMGGLVADGVFWSMFSSFADDADAAVSPGELLLFHIVQQLCAEKMTAFDLGPGEERYKRSWCEEVIAQHDAVLALTFSGRAYAATARLRLRLESLVKSDARLEALVQKVRRRLQGRSKR